MIKMACLEGCDKGGYFGEKKMLQKKDQTRAAVSVQLTKHQSDLVSAGTDLGCVGR